MTIVRRGRKVLKDIDVYICKHISTCIYSIERHRHLHTVCKPGYTYKLIYTHINMYRIEIHMDTCTTIARFTTHDATWQREQDSPRPQPFNYSSYSSLFRAPWSDLSAFLTDDMPWRTCLVLYKQMQANTIISVWSRSLKAVDFSQLACSDVSFTQTQRNFCIQISLHKIITLLGYA